LITGASGGIGLELARVFAQNSYDLILVARSESQLNMIAAEFSTKYHTQNTVLAKDLSLPTAPDEIFAELNQKGVTVDVLVNNAGFATYGYFVDLDIARELQMIQLNVAALTHLTRLFLPGMKTRGSGKIMNVASTASFQPGPLMAVYYATKAFVLYFSEAIAEELDGTGVTVTALCPGPTESGFQKRAAMEDSKLVQSGLMTSAAVAQIGYNGLMKGQRVIIPGLRNKILALTPRFAPRRMVTRTVLNLTKSVGH
jgi:uncharacterized protein